MDQIVRAKHFILAIVLLMVGNATHAVTVGLQVVQSDICGQSVGILQANASGGTEPYQYDWYRIVNDTPEVHCLDCGANIQGLSGNYTYKVIVTDALLNMAEATAYISAAPIWGAPDYFYVFPYQAGELPFLKVVVGGWGQMAPGSSVLVEVAGADLEAEPDWSQLGIGLWWFRPIVPSGVVTVTYTYPGGQCVVQEPFDLPAPTVLPDMVVLDVQGSCSNAATGSVTIALNNGVGMGWLHPWRVGPSWSQGQHVPNLFLNDATSIVTLTNLYAGADSFFVSGNSLNASPPDAGLLYNCFRSIAYTIPDLGPTCGSIQGRVFMDDNLNCSWQGNEGGPPNVLVEVQPGPHYTNTSSGGQYQLNLPNGSYSAALISNVVEEHCTGAAIPFTIAGNSIEVNMPSISLLALDADIALSSGPARPGFEYRVALSTRNRTPSTSGAVSVTMEFDPVLGFISATPSPTAVSGTTLTWEQAQFTPYEQRSIQVRLQIPADVGLIGTDLITTASITTVNADADPTNNSATIQQTVTGSFDPNDKLATTSSRASDALYFIGQDDWIDYTIRFQNTGTDTAFHVIVTDTLPSTFDLATLEVGAASHAFTWALRDQGTLKFRFFDILLPDSNVNEASSHGFVSFRIRPKQPLVPGAVIENTANIYFDFNPPVITEPSVLVAEFSTGGLGAATDLGGIAVYPNPTIDAIDVVSDGSDMQRISILVPDGRVVLVRAVSGTRTHIDLTGLAEGAYVVLVLGADGTMHPTSLIKQDQ